jgi:hypothetical protein
VGNVTASFSVIVLIVSQTVSDTLHGHLAPRAAVALVSPRADEVVVDHGTGHRHEDRLGLVAGKRGLELAAHLDDAREIGRTHVVRDRAESWGEKQFTSIAKIDTETYEQNEKLQRKRSFSDNKYISHKTSISWKTGSFHKNDVFQTIVFSSFSRKQYEKVFKKNKTRCFIRHSIVLMMEYFMKQSIA